MASTSIRWCPPTASGLSAGLPHAISSGIEAHGIGAATAERVAYLPPVSILFAAFLGYKPLQHLLGSHVLATIGSHSSAILTGRSFFPHLISGPFRTGLHETFLFAIAACLIAAAASAMRGGRPQAGEETESRPSATQRVPLTPTRREGGARHGPRGSAVAGGVTRSARRQPPVARRRPPRDDRG